MPPPEALAERLRIAELVGEVSRRFIDLPSAEVHTGIDGALRTIVDAFGFDRGVIAMWSKNGSTFTMTHRYAPGQIRALFEVGDTSPASRLPYLSSEILANREIAFSGGETLPESAVAERVAMQFIGATSAAVLPMVVGGEVIGAVCFFGALPWDTSHLPSLRTVAQIFASALDRKRGEDSLREHTRLTELISDVSRRLVNMPGEIDSALDDALRRVSELCGFLRSVVYEISDDRKTFSSTHRYLSPGTEVLIALGAERPIEELSLVFARADKKRPFFLSKASLPPEAAPERNAFALRNMDHVVVVPLVLEGVLLGILGFEVKEPPTEYFMDALAVLGELFTSAIARSRTERMAAQRLRFEEALAQISARLVKEQPQDFDASVEDALGIVARSLEFDRAVVFELTGDGKFFALTHEWCAGGVQSFRKSMSGLTIEDFGWPLTELRKGRALAFGPREIPPDAVAAQRVLGRDGTRLMAFVPLVVAGELLGCIGLHQTRSGRLLSERQIERLRLVGEIVADAMARRSAEASLKQSEARFAQVVASALDGFVLVNEAGVILECTPQMERILGVPRGEMLGTPFADRFVVPDGARRSWDSPRDLQELAQRIPGKRLELLGKHRDGHEVPIELSISVLDGKLIPVYALFIRDITDRRRAEQVRQQAFDEIARLKLQIEGERDYLREEIREEHHLGEFVGRSDALKNVLMLVDSVASTSATVLIRGESGVGKELVARAIHARSHRANGPLVKVNCASIPKELFESEFFGHVRGSFTGAHKDRAGRFELAEHGTLFLDEIGEIPLALQAKLLRVLQENEFERIGDDRTRRVDVRVVVATNRDLEREAAEGTFRKDLYYRLSVFPVEVPPLRERRDDIAPLAEHFLKLLSTKLGRSGLTFTDTQLRTLQKYAWPGNVRELQHVIERAVILSPRPPLRLDMAVQSPGGPSEPVQRERVLTEDEVRHLERNNIVAALERCDWRVAGGGGAAELLGLSASTLRDRIRSFDIRKPAG